MNNIDKKEKRAEYVNTRYTRGGKGDAPVTTHKDYARGALWCIHGRMKDRCTTCQK